MCGAAQGVNVAIEPHWSGIHLHLMPGRAARSECDGSEPASEQEYGILEGCRSAPLTCGTTARPDYGGR